MAGRGHEPPPHGPQDCVDLFDVPLELLAEPGQRKGRAVGFELDHVQDQFIGPAQRPHLDFGHNLARDGGKDLVGDGKHRQAASVHDHVLQLETDGPEEVQGLLAH